MVLQTTKRLIGLLETVLANWPLSHFERDFPAVAREIEEKSLIGSWDSPVVPPLK